MVADLAELADLAADLTEWETLEEDHALSVIRLWDRRGLNKEGRPRTSQRALVSLLASHRTVYGGGGNRSGKTFGMKAAVIALALGSEHPDARAFWVGNGIDPDAFPAEPANADRSDGEVWIVAKSSSASNEYHRTAIEVLLTPGTFRWRNRDGKGMATLWVDCPGFGYPAVLRFKSDDQGRDRMQGQKCRAIWHDEEGHDESVWDECATRLVDCGGWHLMTNTPIAGVTWVEWRLVAKTSDNAEHDCQVYRIHSVDNPHLSEDGLAKLGRGGDAMRDAKLYGRAMARVGRVWPLFEPQVHIVPPFDLPSDWTRFRAIDFGTRNPFVCLWSVLTPIRTILDDGRLIPEGSLVVYREHYQAERTLRWHAERIHELEGWVLDEARAEWRIADDSERIEMTWADPEDAQQLLALVHDHDIDAVPALKAVSAGIDVVATMLGPHGADGLPAIFFFSTLTHTGRELGGYVWAEGTQKKDQPNKPKKKDDHCCDVVRYTAMGVSRY